MEPDFTPAGRLKYFLPEWRELTSDPHILQTVKGFNVEFLDRSLHKSSPKEIPFNPQETHIPDSELEKLCRKGVIARSLHYEGELISANFF